MYNETYTWKEIFDTDKSDSYLAQLYVTRKLDYDFRSGNFKETDEVLKTININDISVKLMISILSSTHPTKNKLKNRDIFYTKVEKYVTNNIGDPKEILKGLK